jgi:hypothetical protein
VTMPAPWSDTASPLVAVPMRVPVSELESRPSDARPGVGACRPLVRLRGRHLERREADLIDTRGRPCRRPGLRDRRRPARARNVTSLARDPVFATQEVRSKDRGSSRRCCCAYFRVLP